ncbi:hypothetical protein K2X33_15995 [bacterium]|nr:hypothetical protein [bacterium]
MKRSLKSLLVAGAMLAVTQTSFAAEKAKIVAAAPVAKPAPAQATIAPSLTEQAGVKTYIEGSNRMRNRGGVYLSVLGEPFGVAGVNAAWNATDFLRVHGGTVVLLEENSSGGATPHIGFGAGVKFMVPTWSFTPVVGSQFTFYPSGVWFQSENIGLEYTAPSGFYIGAGINTLFIGGAFAGGQSADTGSKALGNIAPYFNIGTFF